MASIDVVDKSMGQVLQRQCHARRLVLLQHGKIHQLIHFLGNEACRVGSACRKAVEVLARKNQGHLHVVIGIVSFDGLLNQLEILNGIRVAHSFRKPLIETCFEELRTIAIVDDDVFRLHPGETQAADDLMEHFGARDHVRRSHRIHFDADDIARFEEHAPCGFHIGRAGQRSHAAAEHFLDRLGLVGAGNDAA